MGKVSKENGVLKLVRAGGIVELYKHPIEAARIMERYPRHCVTRPDFFRNPYIVVKPESVLRPGKVFFIVPYHTVYRLLKSRGYRCKNHCTPDHNDADNKQTLDQMENVDTSFFHQIVAVENVRNKKPSNQQVAKASVEVKRDNFDFRDGDYDSDENHAAATPTATATSGYFRTRKKGGGLAVVSNDTTASRSGCLKPCLKKNRSNKTRLQEGLRVRFMLPDEDDDDDEKWDTDFWEF